MGGMPLSLSPPAQWLPYMSLTNADYVDGGDQSSDESEELDDAKSQPKQLVNGSGGAGAAAAAAPAGSGGSKDSGNARAAEDHKMLVDVVSETEKGCQVWVKTLGGVFSSSSRGT